MKTPLGLLLHETPDYTFLKVFGCACWPHTRPYNNHKLEFWSKKCVFLGYSSLHKGYKCLHVPSNRVFISRDVVFDETVFLFSALPSSSTSPSQHSSPVMPGQFEDAAYSPLLLPNHGAGISRGARLQLMDISNVTLPSPVATEPECGVPSLSSTYPSVQVSRPLPPAVAVSAPASSPGQVSPLWSSVPNQPTGRHPQLGLKCQKPCARIGLLAVRDRLHRLARERLPRPAHTRLHRTMRPR
jgi:histone deacetylase 1/2